jgi:hypothetical protein
MRAGEIKAHPQGIDRPFQKGCKGISRVDQVARCVHLLSVGAAPQGMYILQRETEEKARQPETKQDMQQGMYTLVPPCMPRRL